MVRRPYIALFLIATAGGACKYLQAPAAPRFEGLRDLRIPETEAGSEVSVDLALEMHNPNSHALELQANNLTLVDDGTGSPLGRAEVRGGRAQLQAKGEGNPSIVDVRLFLGREAWRPDLLTRLREGLIRVKGPLRVLYRGHTYDVGLDQPVTSDSSEGAELRWPKPVAFETPTSLKLVLRTSDELFFEADLHAENRLGQDIEVRPLVVSVGAPKSEKPLIVRLRRVIRLPKGQRVPLHLEGTLDLSSSDETLLDDIDQQGRRIVVGLSGEGRGRTFPSIQLDAVRFEMDLPPPGKTTETSRGTSVTLDSDLRAIYELAITPQEMFGVSDVLSNVRTLLSGSPLSLSVQVRNPLPGSIRHQEGKAELRQGSTGAALVLGSLARSTTMSPRSTTAVPLRIRLTSKGRALGFSFLTRLLSSGGGLPKDSILELSWKVRLPVFGMLEYSSSDGSPPKPRP